MKKKKEQESISKDDFIAYISSKSPEEINKLISEKGKPPRRICPMFFFPDKD